MEHTKEPWKSNVKGQISSGDFHNGDGAIIIGKINLQIDARRAIACVNYCEGVPTETLESGYHKTDLECKGCDGPCGRCQELKIEELEAENAHLRAAVSQMQRMLLPLERLEEGLPGMFTAILIGTDLESLDTYRQTLETALAQIEKNK